MRQYLVPDTHSSTLPFMWVDNDNGREYYVAFDDDPYDSKGYVLKIYSQDITAVIEALEKAKTMMETAGARMEVEH